MTALQSACPAERVTERVVRFLADELKVWGARRRITTRLGTTYDRLNRFCAPATGQTAAKDLTFTIQLTTALGFDMADVLELEAHVAVTTWERILLFGLRLNWD